MFDRAIFYYVSADKEESWKPVGPGELDVGRLLQGKPAWAGLGGRRLNRKTLIIAPANFAQDFKYPEYATIAIKLQELLQAGFLLFHYRRGMLVPIAVGQIPSLFQAADVCSDPKDILKEARDSLRLSPERVVILGDGRLRALARDVPNIEVRLEDFGDGDHSHAHPAHPDYGLVEEITLNKFPYDALTVEQIRELLPRARFTPAYRIVNINARDWVTLMEETTLSISACTITIDAGVLSQVKELTINEIGLTAGFMRTLQRGLPQLLGLTKLTLRGLSRDSAELVLDEKCLSALEEICLQGCTIKASTWSVLLKAMPNVKSIELRFCQFDDIAIPAVLPSLENILLLGCTIDAVKVSSLLRAAPQVKKLFLQLMGDTSIITLPESLPHLETIHLTESMATVDRLVCLSRVAPNVKRLVLLGYLSLDAGRIIHINLPFLVDMKLYAMQKIHVDGVLSLLRAAPNVIRLDLSNCSSIHGDITIDTSLPFLVEINLSRSKIDASALSSLLRVTPNVKRLNLDGCTILGGDIVISESLQFLEEMNLCGSDIDAKVLLPLLRAAPNVKKPGPSHSAERAPLFLERCLRRPIASAATRSTFDSVFGRIAPGDRGLLESPYSFMPGEGVQPSESLAPHRHLYFKHYTPNSSSDVPPIFSDTRRRGKNQGMLIQALSRYSQLCGIYTDDIPKIQKGICLVLSFYCRDSTLDDWQSFMSMAQQWDGELGTLPLVLDEKLGRLWIYISRFQQDNSTTDYYVGDQYGSLLSGKVNLILCNPWHAISVKSHDEQYWFYDPNDVRGGRLLTRDATVEAIRVVLGSLVQVQSVHPAIPKLALGTDIRITNPDRFLEEGGLLVLYQTTNGNSLFHSFLTGRIFSQAALEGLLLRDTAGIPAWFTGVSRPQWRKFSLSLLQIFKCSSPHTFQYVLQSSLACVEPRKKFWLIAKLVTYYGQDDFVKELCGLLRSAPQKGQYDLSFSTWSVPQVKSQEPTAFAFSCLTSSVRTLLIETLSAHQLNALRFALEGGGRDLSRPIYYVHSPEDLVCQVPVVERAKDGSTGILKPAPGGALYDFITDRASSSPRVLLVNYATFEAHDIVRSNTLLDKTPSVDGELLPDNMLVIGLIDTSNPRCYRGADFFSRFEKRFTCPIRGEVFASIPVVPFAPADVHVEGRPVINLFHGNDWKSRLLGTWVPQGNVLRFQEGQLPQALIRSSTIEIHNGLWENEEFMRFWQEACMRGQVQHNGLILKIPEGFSIIRREGYDWSALKAHISASKPESSQVTLLNPSTLYTCFSHHRYEDTTSQLVHDQGVVASHAGQCMHVYLTRSLDMEDDWAKLLSECQRYKTTLFIQRAPGVRFPAGLEMGETPSIAATADIPIFYGEDVDAVVALLQQEAGVRPWTVIDVSECAPGDLFERVSGCFNREESRFEFNETTGAVNQALAKGGRILLKGVCSAELADYLAPRMLPEALGGVIGHIGKLAVVFDKASADVFSYVATTKRRIDDALVCRLLGVSKLDESFPRDVAFASLRARYRFLEKHPGQDSDALWRGLGFLPQLSGLDTLEDASLTQEVSHQCMGLRLQAVQIALTGAPYVFLSGLSGVGKTSFVTHILGATGPLYIGEERVVEWAEDDTKDKPVYLFIDEANLSRSEWSQFEGMFEEPRTILIKSRLHVLRENHKVIFAGNPTHYSEERKWAQLFQRHGNVLSFLPLPLAVIYQEILKPVFAGTALGANSLQLSRPFLEVYRFLVKHSTSDVLISPRELQMMALLTLSFCRANPSCTPEQVACYYAYQLAAPLVPETVRASFDSFDTKLSREAPALTGDYFLTPSRYPVAYVLEDMLNLREMRRELPAATPAQLTGGLGGVFIEGSPGIGKSELIVHVLRKHGFTEAGKAGHPAIPASDKLFYRMPVSWSVAEKKKLLEEAFHQGAVVIIDEFDSMPMMEKTLNALLMGKTSTGQLARKPGFLIIGTGNSIALAGREALSTALLRRLVTCKLAPYPNEELLTILTNIGLTKLQAESLMQAFNEALAQAKRTFSPEPSIRDLLRIACQEVEACSKEHRSLRLGRFSLFSTSPTIHAHTPPAAGPSL